ncbi:MAG: hypothetical protein JNK53_07660 [Phycisphaerae bacterium]|nr:hypothetical protein [Phycisphaerae bacterium]
MSGSERVPLRTWTRAMAVGALLLIAGCSSGTIAAPTDDSSHTGGLAMQLWYAQIETRQYQLFEVGADGSFKYGGGMEAFNRKTDWTGKLTEDEARDVRAQVDEAGWLTEANAGRKTADSPLAEFRLYADGKTRAFEIHGPDPRVTRLVNALQKVANQRFDRLLQQLPEAGPQPR